MKRALLIALLAVAPSTAVLSASPSDNGTAATTSTQSPDSSIERMQQNVDLMQQQMRQLRETQDPQEREKLLADHMQTMYSQMELMRGMGMTGGVMHGQGAMGGATGSGMMNGTTGGHGAGGMMQQQFGAPADQRKR